MTFYAAPEPDLRYSHFFQRPLYLQYWNKPLKIKNELAAISHSDVVALPSRPLHNNLLGTGALLDLCRNEIPQSYMYGLGCDIYMHGKYKFDESSLRFLKGKYLYLGFIDNHWGHFIRDYTTRLYAVERYRDHKFFFLARSTGTPFEPFPNIKRFLNLLGLNEDNMLFITSPTCLESVVIPQQSYHMGKYISQAYFDTFTQVASTCVPTAEESYEHIYLSRSKWNAGRNKEIGNHIIDSLYENLGYKTIYPEQESLDNQIFYLKTCSTVAAISSSLIHNFIFCVENKPSIHLINKTYLIAQSMFETCRFASSKTLLLDFFEVKHPVSYGFGPFFLCRNKNMEKFETDNGITPSGTTESEYDVARSVNRYNRLFYSQPANIRKFIGLSDNPDSPHFLNPLFLKGWMERFYKYDVLLFSDPFTLLNLPDSPSKVDIFNCIWGNLFYYNIGWSKPEHISGPMGSRSRSVPICAFSLGFINRSRNVYYRYFYDESGWSEVYKNGAHNQEAGDKPLRGLKVWLDSGTSERVAYRVFTKDWSEWRSNGHQMVCSDVIYAIQIKLVQDQRGPRSAGAVYL